MSFRIRPAEPGDVPLLRALIDASVRGLQAGDYTPAQIDASLRTVYGVDSRLIADRTYFVAEHLDEPARRAPLVVGCGGWSRRSTLYGGDQWTAREDSLLDPIRDAAKIRAFFIHPDWARKGIGSLILEACEAAAKAAGFSRLEMGATLTGVPFHRAKGYVEGEVTQVPLGDTLSMPIVRMSKPV